MMSFSGFAGAVFSLIGLVFWLALTFAAAWFGAQFAPGEWYAALKKPALNPPAWIFAPVWTVLYLLMAVAAWLVWRRHGFTGAFPALALFVAQLIVNAAWSWLFFGLHRIGVALADLAGLWLILLATLVAFWSHSQTAGLLMLPYFLWVSFAAYLNYQLWRLNP